MLPGLVAGFYTSDECHVDLSVLCTFASAILIHAEAIGIDKQVVIHCRDVQNTTCMAEPVLLCLMRC